LRNIIPKGHSKKYYEEVYRKGGNQEVTGKWIEKKLKAIQKQWVSG
jgi:hypothetical protein